MIMLSAGHDSRFWGASNIHYGVIEHYLALDICDMVMARFGHDIRVGFLDMSKHARMWKKRQDSLNAKVALLNHLHQIEPVDLAIELHFNACPSHLGHGAECLYWGNQEGEISERSKYFADLFLPELEAFDGKIDGRDNRHDQSLAWLSQTAMPAIVMEPLFIDNENDVLPVLSHNGRALLAETICRCIKNALEEL